MSSHAWRKLRSPVLPSYFFPETTFQQRPALRGDVLLARCGVRERAVQPVGVSHDWLRGSVLLLPRVALPILALPDLRQYPLTLPNTGLAIDCHEHCVQSPGFELPEFGTPYSHARLLLPARVRRR